MDIDSLDWVLAAVLVIAAPCVGSFLGVVAERLPRGETLVLGRSRCRNCATPLTPRDLVPLVSWAAAGGRCRHCGARLGLGYPAIELAALGVALWSLSVLPGWLALVGCLLGWTLLTLALIDARTFMIPNVLSLPLIAAGLLLAPLLPAVSLWDHVLGAAFGAALIAVTAAVYRRLRGREGIGMGDAKLLAAAGAWVGWQGLGSVLLLAAVVGLGVSLALRLRSGAPDLTQPIPFGPYLALGFWLTWLYGPITWSPS